MTTTDTTVQGWKADTVYGQAGTEVSENGAVYRNNWWTQGDDPAASVAKSAYGPWSLVTPSVPVPAPAPVAPTPAPAAPASEPTAPAARTGRYFSPYVDMGLTADHDLLGIARRTGHLDYTLAFVQSTGQGTVGFAGNGALGQENYPGLPSLKSQIHTLQAEGGTITVSFGGAAGQDPAMAATSAAQLQAQYQSVIDTYGVNHLDFDIEGASIGDQASITRRDQAVAGLERANPGLHVSYTVPVTPTGLDAAGANVLRSAARDGVRLDVVNIMAMDYGAGVDNGGAMGDDAISGAKGTEAQIVAAGLDAKVGITPMIGRNDVASEVFGLADASKVEAFAAATPWVAGIGMWSIARDNGDGAGGQAASATDSSISQKPYEFSSIFSQVSADTFTFDPGSTGFSSGVGTSSTVADFLTGTDRIDFTQGPAGTASNFGAAQTASTDFASIQALAQTLINGGDAYAFVADGVDGFLFTTGGSGTAIHDAVRLAGAGNMGAIKSADIAHGAMA